MSKIYEHELQMQELSEDLGWNEQQEQQEVLVREEMDMMKAFEDFIDGNVEETKAREFARKVVEA